MLSLFKISYAQAAVDMTAFGSTVKPIIDNIIYPVILFVFGLAVIIFVWGALQFIIHGDDPKARETGRLTILYGTLGMFIMVSAWGIIYLISNTVKDVAGN